MRGEFSRGLNDGLVLDYRGLLVAALQRQYQLHDCSPKLLDEVVLDDAIVGV